MTALKNNNTGYILIFLSVLCIILSVLMQEPIAQDLAYHQFKDTRTIWGIPNFWNVISNLPFLVIGILGIVKISLTDKLNITNKTKSAYTLLFLGTALVGLGSGYYHIHPNNETLVCDRLPMAVTYMALFTIIISEFISVRIARKVLFPLAVTGILSVVYWYYTETLGRGDLRFYILVQFLPLLVAPVILLCFQSLYTKQNTYWIPLTLYLLAKICELYDTEIYNITGFFSGHSIKHILIALGIYILLASYERRKHI